MAATTATAHPEVTADPAANKALVRRFFEEVFNRGNLAVVDELWKPDQIESGKRATEHLRTAFPDYHRTVEAQVAEGDLVVTRWTMRGTHRGPYRSGALGRTLAPTGRRVEVPGTSIHRVAGGRIVESWVQGNDSAALLRQLGALPDAASPPSAPGGDAASEAATRETMPTHSSAVDFVAYGVRDLTRAVAFYRDTLGLRVGDEFPEFRWVEFDAGNVTLAVAEAPYASPPTPGATGGAMVALAVPDVRAAVEVLRGQGVPVLSEPEETPVCHLATISDPDGNRLYLHQRKDGTAG